jgi:hypothetical protein
MKNLIFSRIFFLAVAGFVVMGCKKDPCETVKCENGGYCANGSCVCPPGFTGADCSQQKTPTVMFITRIELINTPPTTPAGFAWDNSEGPGLPLADPYIVLLQNTTLYTTDVSIDRNYNQVVTYNPTTPIAINSPNSLHAIEVYDFDVTSPDEFMGGFEFTPYSSTNRFPSSQVITVGNISIRLYYTYAW